MTSSKFNILISLQVVAIFAVAIFASLIPEFYPDFFGDYICEGKLFNKDLDVWLGCTAPPVGVSHGPTNHWGYRHWLFFTMGLILFVLQAIRLVIFYNKNKAA